MSERYLFNKKLQRRNRKWFLLGGGLIALVILKVFAAPAMAQEQEAVLLDPYADENKTFNSTLTDIDFSREAGNLAVTTISFDNGKAEPQLVEAQGQLSITLPGTELAEDQLVELDVAQFGTNVTTIETFQDAESARLVIGA